MWQRGAPRGSSRAVAGEAATRAVSLGIACLKTCKVKQQLGGVSSHLAALRSFVSLPLNSCGMFTAYGIHPPRGIILYGSPRTGKPMLSFAAAKDAHATFFVVNGPDIVHEHYGSSEATLRGVFAAAQAVGPAVVFIDEIDAIMPGRGNGVGRGTGFAGSKMSNRLVATLLTLMDGMLSKDGPIQQHFVVIAATNRLDFIDPALRCPGQFDRELEVGAPTPTARGEMLSVQLRATHHNLSFTQIDHLVACAHGFVAADLAALCREAAMACLRCVIAEHKEPGMCRMPKDAGSDVVRMEDFTAALPIIKPSALRDVKVADALQLLMECKYMIIRL